MVLLDRSLTLARSNYSAIASIPPRTRLSSARIWVVTAMPQAHQTLLG